MFDLESTLTAARELRTTAHEHDDAFAVRAFDKAIYHLLGGVRVIEDLADLLIPSAQGGGVVYRVGSAGCTCPHGAAGSTKGQCWHSALYEAYTVALSQRAEDADLAAIAATLDEVDQAVLVAEVRHLGEEEALVLIEERAQEARARIQSVYERAQREALELFA